MKLKIYEIKEPVTDRSLIDNIYHCQKLIQAITRQSEFLTDINTTDFDYINIILDKTKINLQKVYSILKLN